MKHKRIIIFLFALLFLKFISFGQVIITYDFHKKKFVDKTKQASKDEIVVLRVVNINRLIYNVEIQNSQSDFHTSNQNALKPLTEFNNIYSLTEKKT